MEGTTTTTSPRLERISSLRQQRDRTPERDRLHVRFEEANNGSTENIAMNANTTASDNEIKEIRFSGNNSLKNDNNSRAQYSLKVNREESEFEGEKRKGGRSNNESSEENATTASLTAEILQNRQLPRRPDSIDYKATTDISAQIASNVEAMSQNDGNKNLNNEHNDENKQEYAMEEAEVNSDDFNEKLASLDENTRKYYHFFHLLDGVQSGCSVKTKKGVAGEFPGQDSFPMFKSAKYWIAIYWGVTLPMDAWAICFYTDHWTAHHGPKSALRTLPLSEISEVYLEPKTSAFFRIYRGKEVTQCTPNATTLASALWADAIFAVLQLHNDHDIKTIKDYFQAYQSFVHVNRKQNNNDTNNNNNNSNTPRTKRQSIFGKMKEIFSSSSGDNHQYHPTGSEGGGGGGEGSNGSGNEGGVFSSEGEQTSPRHQQNPPLPRSKSSRAIRRWTTAVGGAFLNRSKSADDGVLSAANDHSADNDAFNATSYTNDNKKGNSQHTTSVFFSLSSPTRRTSTTSTTLRRDSRSYANPSSEGFLTQSVIDFHRPESASSLRMRESSLSEDNKTHHSVDYHEGEEEEDDIRSRYTESIRSSKHFSMNSFYVEENDDTHNNSDAKREEIVQDKPVKSILVNALEKNKDNEQKEKEEKEKEDLDNQKLNIVPEPRSIHDRMRHVSNTTSSNNTHNAYSSGDERQLHYKKKKPAHLRDIHNSGNNNSSVNNPGYFSDSHQIRHYLQNHHHPQSSTNRTNFSNENVATEEAKSYSQLEINTSNNSNNRNQSLVQEFVPPRPPAAELGQFTVLDMIYAQNVVNLSQQQQRQKGQEQELSLKKKILPNTYNSRVNNDNNTKLQSARDTVRGEKQQFVTQETCSTSIRSRGNVSPTKQLSTKQYHSDVGGIISQEKKNRDTLLAEFLGGDLSTSFSLFSKRKEQREQQQQQQQTVKQVSPKDDVKRHKGYLARALSSSNNNINHNKYSNNKVTNSNPLSSMFQYGKDRANSATTDDEDAAQRELQKQKYFAAMNNTNNNNDDNIKNKSPISTRKRRKQPPTNIAVNDENNLANDIVMSTVKDKPLEVKDLLEEESKDDKARANMSTINNSNNSGGGSNNTNSNTTLQVDTINSINIEDQGVMSPTAPQHKLFKVFHPNSPTENSPASITPFAYTPSAVQVPGVSSPLMEIDSQGIQGMLTHLEAIRQQHSSQRPVHEKISFLNNNNSSGNTTSAIPENSQDLTSSANRRSPRIGRHYSSGNMNMSLVSSPLTSMTATNGTGPTSTKSPHNELCQHTMMLQRKNLVSPRFSTTPKIPVPVPFSTTIQATLVGYPVTLTLLTKNELRQKLLNRPNLLPMRPGLTLSPVKQRPVVIDNEYESSNHIPNHTAQSARLKYLRQQQQEREALEVTAMTMMAIAAELLEGDCYLSIQHVSNTLYTNEVQGMPVLAKSVLSAAKSQTEALLEDIVEEYVYIPLTRMMTLEVDESRSGLFRFLLSKLLPTSDPNSNSATKRLDACLFVRSFDLLPSESLFLSLFSSVIGASAASISTSQTSIPASPSSPMSIVGTGHLNSNSNMHHAFEEAGGSAVGQRYNVNRVPQVKDPKRKVISSSSSQSNGMVVPTTPQSPSGTSFAILSFGGGGGSSSMNEGAYVSCVMKANSPEILPAFLQTMMYLRQR